MIAALKQRVHRRRSEKEKALPYSTVKVLNYRPPGGEVNFGDELALVIPHLMLARGGRTVLDEARAPTTLLTVGSVMHLANDGDVVWGTGVNGKTPAEWHRFRRLDVRAVRGPRTRAFLMARGVSVPEIYGDPGLLMAELLHDRIKVTGDIAAAFVPNLNDLDLVAGRDLGVPMISPIGAWHRVITEIARCRFVIASSLHGLVIAESFGIPARYVRLSDRENLFKYEDFYEGTGRANVAAAASIVQALDMGGAPLPQLELEQLKRAFPVDLWL